MTTPTIARETELGQIKDFVQEVAAGRGRGLIIEGEPGIGKTHLVDAAVAFARTAGMAALQGAARHVERDLPFAAILNALPPDARKEMATLIPDRPRTEPELRFRLIEFVLDKLEEETVTCPTLLVIDDLQWADAASLTVIQRLAESFGIWPLGVVVAVRPLPRTPELDAVLIDLSKRSLHIRLEALAPAEVSRLAEMVLGAPPGPKLSRVLDRSGGNPFYILEVLASAASEIVRDGAIAEAEHYQPSSSLYGTIVDRLDFLPDDTRELLRTSAVLGTRFEFDDLLVAMARTSDESLRLIAPAVQMGIVAMAGSEVRFRHDLVRDALYEAIPEAARPTLHRDVAKAFAGAGRPSISIAPHLKASAPAWDAETLTLSRRTARELARRAPAVAAALFETAVAVAGRKHQARYAIEAEWSRALVWAGRSVDAERIARRLLSEKRGGEMEAVARRALLDALFLQGRLAESLADVEELIGAMDPSEEHAGSLARAAGAFVQAGDLQRGENLAREAVRLSGEIHDDASLSVALTALARVAFIRGETASQAAFLERAAALVLGGAGPVSAMEAVLVHAHLLARVAGRFDDALRLLQEGSRVVEEEGFVLGAWMIQAGFGVVLFQTGQLDDAATAFETSIRLADELKARPFVPSAHAYLAYIDALRGDHSRAEDHLTIAEDEARRQTDSNVAADFDVLWAHALVDELRGRDADALDLLEGLRRRAARGPQHLLGSFVWFGLSEIRIARRLGRQDLAEEVVRTLERGVEPFRKAFPVEPWNAAFIELCRGIAQHDADLLVGACDKLRPTGRRLLHATSCEDAGRVLASRDRIDEAILLLEEARLLWAEAGAVHKERQLAGDLRSLGVRGVYGGRPGRPRRGWKALTPTEISVARLIAEGLTYRAVGERLFISKRTVETHVAHIFEKLGISSRADLAADAARHLDEGT